MANIQYAQEWIELAKHNLEAAELPYDSEHYTDVIAIELHQAIGKTLRLFTHTTILKS